MQLKYILKSISDTYNFKKNSNVIFLNTGDILSGKFLHNNYSEAKFLPGQAKKSIQNNDILFSEIRPANQRFALVCVENPYDYVVSTKLMVLRCFNPNYSIKYVYNFLTQPTILNQLQTLAESRSGTFPQITFSEIETLEIPELSLEQQKHIVDILGTLDKKIEFLDKEKALYIKLGKTLYENIIQNTTEKISLENIFTFTNGYSFKSKDYIQNGTHKVITIKNITESGFVADTADTINYNLRFEKQLLSAGDILLTMTGEVGRSGIVDEENCLLNQRVLKVSSFSKYFTYFTLLYYCEQIKALAKGSVQQNLGLKELNKMEISFANENEYEKYDFIVIKLIEIAKQKAKLKALKDLYLQKFFG